MNERKRKMNKKKHIQSESDVIHLNTCYIYLKKEKWTKRIDRKWRNRRRIRDNIICILYIAPMHVSRLIVILKRTKKQEILLCCMDTISCITLTRSPFPIHRFNHPLPASSSSSPSLPPSPPSSPIAINSHQRKTFLLTLTPFTTHKVYTYTLYIYTLYI